MQNLANNYNYKLPAPHIHHPRIINSMLQSSIYLLYAYLRPLLKWFLHRFTGLCELQRLCYGTAEGARRTHSVERSLRLSRHMKIRQMVIYLDGRVLQPVSSSSAATLLDQHQQQSDAKAFVDQCVVPGVHAVLRAKRIDTRVHPDLGRMLRGCIESAWGYRRLFNAVEALRCTQFDSSCVEHEEKLLRLWQLLNPDVELEARVTKQWQDIGFQVNSASRQCLLSDLNNCV